MSKVALITGGASGMGLAVAKVLAGKGWKCVLLDMNEKAGAEAVASVPNSDFIRVDVTSWDSLSSAFDSSFEKHGTIDFVYANAGIVERDNFYEKLAPEVLKGRIPPRPNQLTIDINLKAVIDTAYLAQHYFRLSPHHGSNACLVMTASVGGLYPAQFCPIYAASKAGVVNFMRSIAFPYHHYDGVRCYATCPGTVRTNLLNSAEWSTFPEEYFTPIESIASTVAMLVEGGKMTDAKGNKVEKGKDYGLAVEINGNNFYFRDPPEFCDDTAAMVMKATSMENQIERLSGYKGQK